MKQLNDIIKLIFDAIFSFPMFMIVSFSLFIYFMTFIWERDHEAIAEAKAVAATCYAMGMVDVDTTAGKRCVAPKNLNEPKIVERVVVEK